MDFPTATAEGIAVTITPNYGNNAVAEHTIALMFNAARKDIFPNRELINGK